MKPVRLLDLGLVSPLRSQTVYHAVANALTADSPNTIILVGPSRPYVCIGYHQDLQKEVDVDYCRAHDLPVYRRQVGGGAVYLDANQVFIQWVFHDEDLPAALDARYALYIEPLVATYRALGVPAYHRPVNDIHVDGKKIGGTGAAEIGGARCLWAASCSTSTKRRWRGVLKVPHEKMRDKVFESLEQYMTTLREQHPGPLDRDAVQRLYLEQAGAALGATITASDWTPDEEAWARRLDARFVTEAWLMPGSARRPAGVKIHEDVRVGEAAVKAPGGLVRATVRTLADAVDAVELSGDFTLLPSDALTEIEDTLIGAPCAASALEDRVAAVYRARHVQSPGLEPAHIAQAVLAAVAV